MTEAVALMAEVLRGRAEAIESLRTVGPSSYLMLSVEHI
jgi:hypothetical protein